LPSGRIDFYLEDRNGSSLFVEVEWAGLNYRQILGYAASIKNRETGRNYRIMWLIPEDLKNSGVLLADALLRSMIEEFQIKPSELVTWCISHFISYDFQMVINFCPK